MDFDTKESFLGDILRVHMELLRLADNKANMLLMASSLVLTLSIQYLLREGPLFYGFLVITLSTLSAATLALLVILPRGHDPEGTNLMYFRSFLEMDEENYIYALKKVIADRELMVDEYGREIYNLGEKTLYVKYRYLRAALAVFLGGFLLGATVILVSIL